MTPEITCSVVFGIIASVLALVTILQTYRRGLVSGMITCLLWYIKKADVNVPTLT